LAGLWEQILEALNESRIVPDALQMIDSTVVRAHHQAAGAKGGLRAKVSAAREVASRPRSICGLCCTNPVWDSDRESRVVAVMYEQTHTANLQDQKLASLQ